MIRQELNKICLDCNLLENYYCSGTHEHAYSGCIWKGNDPEDLQQYRREVYGEERAAAMLTAIRERGENNDKRNI